MSKRLHQRLNELSMSLATFDDDGELSFGEDSHLVIEALTELKILWQENRRLRRLIIEWADADDSNDIDAAGEFACARLALRQAVGR